jgi:hypothetical protein
VNETDPIRNLQHISDQTLIPVASLRYKRHLGEMPFIFRLGRKLVCYQSDLDAWIDEQRRATSRPA